MAWKQQTLLGRIRSRWGEKDTPYDRLRDAREIIINYFRPDLGVDYDESSDMLMLGENIYEGSGPWVARKASTAFQGNTVSKELDWIKYAFSDRRLAGIDELDIVVQDMKEHISAVHQRGNFYDNQPQFTLDGWTIGSPLSFIEEDQDTNFVMHIPLHWLTYRIFYNRFNRSEGVIVKDEQWTAKKCLDKFIPKGSMETRQTKADEIFSTGLAGAIRQGKLDERFTTWRAVFKSNDPIWDGEENASPIIKEWHDVYFEETGLGERENKPLLSNGYFSKPYVHWDYDKKLWESASRTPAFSAIYDNVAMQQIFKNYLENMQLKVRPAMVVLMGMKDRIDFSSEGINYVNQNEWSMTPKPIIDQVGDIRFETETIQIFKENLSRHFSLDVFQIFTDLARDTSQEFRVLQLMEIAGEKITVLLPMIESHENYLAQVDARVRDIEFQAGRGPFNRANLENVFDILDQLLGEDARNIKIQPEFIGTLRQVQRNQQKSKPLHLGIGALAEFGELMKDDNYVRNMIKPYEVGDKILQAVSFEQELIKEQGDFEDAVIAENEANAQQQQFANQVEMAKALKGSPVLEQIAGEVA